MINKIYSSFFLIVLAFTIVACDSDNKEQQALFEQVMLVHDEVMPEMGNLRALASDLSGKADSLALDSLNDNSSEIQQMRNLSKNLKDANEGMMEWMRQFEQLKEGTPHGEVMEYLNEQRKSIQKVRDDMLNSKNQAEKYMLNFN